MIQRSGADIRQNLVASTLLGPLRSIIPAVLSVFLYPMLLRAGGLELVGTWSVLQLIVLYSGLCAGGLPSLMMRRVAADVDAGSVLVKLVGIVQGGYLLCGVVLVSSAALCAEPFWRLMHLPAGRHIALILATTMLAGVAANMANLYAAVLSGLHKSYVAQMAETAGAVSQFIVATVFIFLRQPVIGLATSLLAGKLTVFAIVNVATWRQAPDYRNATPRLDIVTLCRLLREARGFILLDTGNALSEAMVRVLLVVTAGPAELGLYDIANRLPVLIRNSFTYGLLAMFPAMTALHAQKNQDVIAQVLRGSLAVVVFLIITPLAAYLLLAKPLLFLWLGNVGTQVSTITLVTTAWWIITSYNIPFYFTIQALGMESVVARNTWLRILLIVVGSAIFHGIITSAIAVSWLVLATGLIAEVQLYAEAQNRAYLLTMALARSRDRIVLIGSVVLFISAVWLRVDVAVATSGLIHILVALGVVVSIWLALLRIATGRHPVRFLLGTLRAPAGVEATSTQSR